MSRGCGCSGSRFEFSSSSDESDNTDCRSVYYSRNDRTRPVKNVPKNQTSMRNSKYDASRSRISQTISINSFVPITESTRIEEQSVRLPNKTKQQTYQSVNASSTSTGAIRRAPIAVETSRNTSRAVERCYIPTNLHPSRNILSTSDYGCRCESQSSNYLSAESSSKWFSMHNSELINSNNPQSLISHREHIMSNESPRRSPRW